MVETASRDGIGFYEAYRKIEKQKEPAFIESYMTSVKQDTESKRHKKSNLLENVLVVLFVVGAVLYGFAGVVIATVGLLASLLGIVIGAFAIGSAFKSGGGSGE